MKDFFPKLWLSSASFFEPVQYFFNGDFWESFVKKFGKLEKENVLDLACGTGEINNYINARKYLGIDINPSYIELANKKFINKNIQFKLGNIIKLSGIKNFEFATMVSAAHHLSDKDLRLVLSSLKKNNVKSFLIVDALPNGFISGILKWLDATLGGGKYFRTPEEIEKVLKKYKVLKKEYFIAKKSFYKYFYLLIKV